MLWDHAEVEVDEALGDMLRGHRIDCDKMRLCLSKLAADEYPTDIDVGMNKLLSKMRLCASELPSFSFGSRPRPFTNCSGFQHLMPSSSSILSRISCLFAGRFVFREL